MRRHVISASTGLLAVLGHPVGHSVSPAMHNAAIAAAGLDLVYVAFDVAPGSLPAALDGLVALGLRGANVTVPHKRAVMASCVALTDVARAVGAVNTVTVTADGLVGDNTDVAGFLAGLGEVAPARAVVLGAGGAARAVVAALDRRGVAVALLARDRERARALLDAVVGTGPVAEVVTLERAQAVREAVVAADLVVNATPLGWHGERLPAPLHELRPGQVAYDLNYPAPTTPFLADAARVGATAVDGLAMVVGQAAAALASWTGIAPDLAVMEAAARAARDATAGDTSADDGGVPDRDPA